MGTTGRIYTRSNFNSVLTITDSQSVSAEDTTNFQPARPIQIDRGEQNTPLQSQTEPTCTRHNVTHPLQEYWLFAEPGLMFHKAFDLSGAHVTPPQLLFKAFSPPNRHTAVFVPSEH